jgi:hypothetical protein
VRIVHHAISIYILSDIDLIRSVSTPCRFCPYLHHPALLTCHFRLLFDIKLIKIRPSIDFVCMVHPAISVYHLTLTSSDPSLPFLNFVRIVHPPGTLTCHFRLPSDFNVVRFRYTRPQFCAYRSPCRFHLPSNLNLIRSVSTPRRFCPYPSSSWPLNLPFLSTVSTSSDPALPGLDLVCIVHPAVSIYHLTSTSSDPSLPALILSLSLIFLTS